VGLMKDRVLESDPGFDSLNDVDWAQWLESHGAHAVTLKSPIVRGIYELLFAFQEGDPARPSLAAGPIVPSLYQFVFEYRGALLWKMRGGAGDVLIAPLYQELVA